VTSIKYGAEIREMIAKEHPEVKEIVLVKEIPMLPELLQAVGW